MAPAPSRPLAADQQVRLRHLELAVTGLASQARRDRLEASFGKVAGVKGVSIKPGQDGFALVKVWYSEKLPVQAEELEELAEELGHKVDRPAE